MVLAWALGSGFSVRKFREALGGLEPDFERAARAIEVRQLPPGNPLALIAIAEIARCSLLNGAVVVRWDLPAEIIYWPTALMKCAGATTT